MTAMAIVGALVGLLCPEVLLIPMGLIWGVIEWTVGVVLNLISGEKRP